MTALNVKLLHNEFSKVKDNLIAYLKAAGVWDAVKSYQLPTEQNKDSCYVIGISGGKDSSALALLLTIMFPSVPFKLVFTDTMAEPDDVYTNIELIEQFTGIKVVRLSDPLGLFGRIEDNGGFLPSSSQRWCTGLLKIKVLDDWFKSTFNYEHQKVFTCVGFTFGEERVGMITDEDEVESVFPFLDMRIDAEKVFGILASTIGIIETYKTKSRSGCFCCPFLRRYEKTMMLFDRYNEFQRAKQYEKLSMEDDVRFNLNDEPLLRNVLYGPNGLTLSKRMSYYIPKAVDARTELLQHSKMPKRLRLRDKLTKHEEQVSIFDFIEETEERHEEKFIYVAVAYWVSSIARDYFSDFSFSGLYRTEYISHSISLEGLKRSLHFWTEHKLSVAPLYGMTKSELERDLKVGLFQIRVSDVVHLAAQAPGAESYTWSQSESYAQLETITRIASLVLTHEGNIQFYEKEYARFVGLNSDELELTNSYAYSLKQDIDNIKPYYDLLQCSIEWSGVFALPTQEDIDQMTMDAILEKEDVEFKMSGAMTCAICSI